MRMRRAAAVLAGAAFFGVFADAADRWNKFFIQADKALLAGRYEDAIGNYLRAAQDAGGQEIQKTWDDLAYAYLQEKNPARAIWFSREALKKWPQDYDLRMILAVAHVLDGNLNAAREELETIGRDISFDAGWLETASAFVVKNEFGDRMSPEQLDRLKREKGLCFSVQPPLAAIVFVDAFDERNEAAFHFYRGVVEAGLGDPARAEEMFQKAVKAGLPEATVQSGRNQASSGIPVKLRHRFKDHNSGLAWFLHETFLKQVAKGQIAQGVTTLLEALEVEERSFELNHNLALMLLDLDDLDRAEIYGARALWIREDDADSHELMGNIRFRQKDYGLAAYEFRRVLDIEADNPYGHFNLGSALYMLHDARGAEAHWIKAVEGEGRGPGGNAERPAADGILGYSVITRKKPVSYLARLALGKLFKEQGLVDKAIPEFEAAVGLKPNDAAPYLSLGELYLRTNDPGKALSTLERYLYLGGPEEAQARKLLETIKK